MTLQVHESFIKSLPEAFEKMVSDYAAALKDHHRRPVDEVTGVGDPPPVAPHPAVEQALRRVVVPGQADDYVPDYKIMRDPPPPPPTFEEKQKALLLQVHHIEMEMRAKVLPRHRERLVARADAEVASVHPDNRTATHLAYIAERDTRRQKLDQIDHWGARMTHEVGELTEATIGYFHLAPLPI